MQTIVIKTIPHDDQRYETVGDYWTEALPDGQGGVGREFRISDMGNPDYEFLVALHELIESHLVLKRGISDAAIDAFDQAFTGEGEPGDDPAAPYQREHKFATLVEKVVSLELGVDWIAYDAAVMALAQTEPKTHGGHLGATEGA